jgi:hypothetical protein
MSLLGDQYREADTCSLIMAVPKGDGTRSFFAACGTHFTIGGKRTQGRYCLGKEMGGGYEVWKDGPFQFVVERDDLRGGNSACPLARY